MGSDAAAGAPAAPAAGGGSMTMIIAVVVVVVIVVAAVVGYMMMSGGDDLELTGQWTVSGGQVKMAMVINNDTANKTWMNQTIPADPTIIDFDDPTTMPEGWDVKDLGGGNFEIESFEMAGADFGKVTGTYSITDDTMTITMAGSGTYIDGTDYFEIDIDYTMNFAKA